MYKYICYRMKNIIFGISVRFCFPPPAHSIYFCGRPCSRCTARRARKPILCVETYTRQTRLEYKYLFCLTYCNWMWSMTIVQRRVYHIYAYEKFLLCTFELNTRFYGIILSVFQKYKKIYKKPCTVLRPWLCLRRIIIEIFVEGKLTKWKKKKKQ